MDDKGESAIQGASRRIVISTDCSRETARGACSVSQSHREGLRTAAQTYVHSDPGSQTDRGDVYLESPGEVIRGEIA